MERVDNVDKKVPETYGKVTASDKIGKNQEIQSVEKIILCKHKSTSKMESFPHLNVDNVDNYFPRRCSPTCTMSPAPIVINKSPFIHLFNKKFSISSKDGK